MPRHQRTETARAAGHQHHAITIKRHPLPAPRPGQPRNQNPALPQRHLRLAHQTQRRRQRLPRRVAPIHIHQTETPRMLRHRRTHQTPHRRPRQHRRLHPQQPPPPAPSTPPNAKRPSAHQTTTPATPPTPPPHAHAHPQQHPPHQHRWRRTRPPQAARHRPPTPPDRRHARRLTVGHVRRRSTPRRNSERSSSGCNCSCCTGREHQRLHREDKLAALVDREHSQPILARRRQPHPQTRTRPLSPRRTPVHENGSRISPSPSISAGCSAASNSAGCTRNRSAVRRSASSTSAKISSPLRHTCRTPWNTGPYDRPSLGEAVIQELDIDRLALRRRPLRRQLAGISLRGPAADSQPVGVARPLRCSSSRSGRECTETSRRPFSSGSPTATCNSTPPCSAMTSGASRVSSSSTLATQPARQRATPARRTRSPAARPDRTPVIGQPGVRAQREPAGEQPALLAGQRHRRAQQRMIGRPSPTAATSRHRRPLESQNRWRWNA